MTIPEAVQLVLQAVPWVVAGSSRLGYGRADSDRGFGLDLVRLSGLEVGRDIEIRYTGIRPGERLYEEPFFRHEEVLPTRHPKILRATNNHIPGDVAASIELLVAAGRESRPTTSCDTCSRCSCRISARQRPWRSRGGGRGREGPHASGMATSPPLPHLSTPSGAGSPQGPPTHSRGGRLARASSP